MNEEVSVLAGGCFWGLEYLLSELSGVMKTEVGYSGGELENPKYEDVKTGRSGHVESVRARFNVDILSYSELLDYFFSIHDPTTYMRQMNDIGSQYRSVIFYMDDRQRMDALKAVDRAYKNWGKKIVTEIAPFKIFWLAEEYHQKYLIKNPGGYNCHYIRKF
ncbi:MAG: peptide-methionine (S)-S-oxide reductase MsrA [Elusimicrobiales bacterium]|nr:peptide-methionine (S)-S-oxide reductase MsrA [Elusimicrobiales bacterium]